MKDESTGDWRWFPSPGRQTELVEWEHVSPTCSVLRLRRWDEAQDSEPEVMGDGDPASSGTGRV